MDVRRKGDIATDAGVAKNTPIDEVLAVDVLAAELVEYFEEVVGGGASR